jgi:hypothetical protein
MSSKTDKPFFCGVELTAVESFLGISFQGCRVTSYLGLKFPGSSDPLATSRLLSVEVIVKWGT